MKWIILLCSCFRATVQSPVLIFLFFFFSSTCSYYFAYQMEPAKWSTCSSSDFLFRTSAAGFLGFWQDIWLEKYSVSPLPRARGWTSANLSCIIHSISKPTFSCSGSHGAGGGLVGGSERFTFHIQVSSSTLDAQFRLYRRSVIIYYHYIIDVR